MFGLWKLIILDVASPVGVARLNYTSVGLVLIGGSIVSFTHTFTIGHRHGI